MKRIIAGLFVATALVAPASAFAAGPPIHIPQNCHEWNELLHIDNVRSCDG